MNRESSPLHLHEARKPPGLSGPEPLARVTQDNVQVIGLVLSFLCVLNPAVSFGAHQQSSSTCYLVEYKDWGAKGIIPTPSGNPHIAAPAVIVLTSLTVVGWFPDSMGSSMEKENMFRFWGFSGKDTFHLAKESMNIGDSTFYAAFWRRRSQDSIAITDPMMRGAFGLQYNLRQYRDTLAGMVRTWTTVDGVSHAHSGVVAHLFQCSRGSDKSVKLPPGIRQE